ncbi:MAG: ComF family protein [Bacillota bacterium]|jgi:competence protein ComFC
MKSKAGFLIKIKQLFFPLNWCLLCGQEATESGLCEACIEEVKKLKYCSQCGTVFKKGSTHCFFCQQITQYPYREVVVAAPYSGNLRHRLREFKYKNKTWLKRPLTSLLLVALQDKDLREFTVVPVPMFHDKEKERGYNQAALLAQNVAYLLKLPYAKNALVRVVDTPPLYSLKQMERKTALKGAVASGTDSVLGQKVLLIDDISTTCTTTSECARILLAAGATEVLVAVVASTQS